MSAETLQKFYTAFQQKDHAAMQACYDDHARFSDPVFKNLNAKSVRAMWKMFCVNGQQMEIRYFNISADETQGRAEWIATYVFSATGNKVVNHIYSEFTFKNGKILQHRDSFQFYKWARQALGLPGVFLGWTPYLKNKVRKTAKKSLGRFIESQ